MEAQENYTEKEWMNRIFKIKPRELKNVHICIKDVRERILIMGQY